MALLAEDIAAGAVLLEQLDADQTLEGVPPPEAARVAGELLLAMDVEPPSGIPTQSELARRMHADITRRLAAMPGVVPAESGELALRPLDDLVEQRS